MKSYGSTDEKQYKRSGSVPLFVSQSTSPSRRVTRSMSEQMLQSLSNVTEKLTQPHVATTDYLSRYSSMALALKESDLIVEDVPEEPDSVEAEIGTIKRKIRHDIVTNRMCLFLNLFLTFLYQANQYVVAPTSGKYASMLGMSPGMSGAIIGMAPTAAIISTLLLSAWSNYSFKQPLVTSLLLLVTGNLMYACALQFSSMNMLFFGRLLTGLGAPRGVTRRYIADHVSLKDRTMASSQFIAASALGLTAGPLVASLMSTSITNFTIYGYDTTPMMIFNDMTAPGWIMTSLYSLCLILFLFFFQDPSEHLRILDQIYHSQHHGHSFSYSQSSFRGSQGNISTHSHSSRDSRVKSSGLGKDCIARFCAFFYCVFRKVCCCCAYFPWSDRFDRSHRDTFEYEVIVGIENDDMNPFDSIGDGLDLAQKTGLGHVYTANISGKYDEAASALGHQKVMDVDKVESHNNSKDITTLSNSNKPFSSYHSNSLDKIAPMGQKTKQKNGDMSRLTESTSAPVFDASHGIYSDSISNGGAAAKNKPYEIVESSCSGYDLADSVLQKLHDFPLQISAYEPAYVLIDSDINALEEVLPLKSEIPPPPDTTTRSHSLVFPSHSNDNFLCDDPYLYNPYQSYIPLTSDSIFDSHHYYSNHKSQTPPSTIPNENSHPNSIGATSQSGITDAKGLTLSESAISLQNSLPSMHHHHSQLFETDSFIDLKVAEINNHHHNHHHRVLATVSLTVKAEKDKPNNSSGSVYNGYQLNDASSQQTKYLPHTSPHISRYNSFVNTSEDKITSSSGQTAADIKPPVLKSSLKPTVLVIPTSSSSQSVNNPLVPSAHRSGSRHSMQSLQSSTSVSRYDDNSWFWDHISPEVSVILFIYFINKVGQEVVVSSVPTLCSAMFSWDARAEGIYMAIIGALVLPGSIIVGRLADGVSDKSLIQYLSYLSLFSILLLVDNTALPYTMTQYLMGGALLFSFLNTLEGVMMALLSKLVSPQLARGTFNSGLLSTEAGTVGRVVGDMAITLFTELLGSTHLASLSASWCSLVNLLYIPVAVGIMVSIILVSAYSHKLSDSV